MTTLDRGVIYKDGCEPVEVWTDESGTELNCICCMRSVDEGEFHKVGTCSEPGYCGHCGRPGAYGKPCFRMLDGQFEECGQFV